MADAEPDRALILLVEDDPLLQRIMRDALVRDFAVTCADDGRSGLELALALRPDLVITDLQMPRMNGDELVREVRAHLDFDDVPILVVTATLEDDLRIALYRAGAQDFMLKPFSLEELRVRVGNLVQMKRVRDLLRDELDARERDAEVLAREITQKNRDLHDALAEAEAARALAEHASKSKSTFLALATHELRTPLASLRLQLDLLHRVDELTSDRRRALIHRLDGSYRRLHDLIESLLLYAASERSAVPVSRREVALSDVANAVIGRAIEEASRKGVQVALREEGAALHVYTDPMLLQMALIQHY